jgi:hypothetical protein
MMTYVCDKCLTNRSDQGEVYHLTISRIETGKAANKIVKELDICAPCFEKMMQGNK